VPPRDERRTTTRRGDVSTERICVVIADDEPLARRTLRDYLAAVSWIGEIRECGDGLQAATLIDAWQPDLVFLDVVMPGLSGVEVLGRIKHTPHVVFTTAHDEYATTAFELGALDYVLKPFGEGRLLRVLNRARDALGTVDVADRARQLLVPSVPLTRVFVRDGTRIIGLDVSAIESIDADDDYSILWAAGRGHRVRVRLQDVEGRLDSARFVRVHRSHIVNLDFLMACEPYDAWRLEAVLRSGKRIVASRAGTRLLKSLALG
jgi:two-component system, LytTR family, response regulator